MDPRAGLVKIIAESRDQDRIFINLKDQIHRSVNAFFEQKKRIAERGYVHEITPIAPELEYLQIYVNAYNSVRQAEGRGTGYQFSLFHFDEGMNIAKRLDNGDPSVTIPEIEKAEGDIIDILSQHELILAREEVDGAKMILGQRMKHLDYLEQKYAAGHE